MFKRKVKTPGIYNHFKGKQYVTVCISEPVSSPVDSSIFFEDFNELECINVLDDSPINVYISGVKAFHSKKNCDKKMVIYKPLYANNNTFAREYDDFLSVVDTNKYPSYSKAYRFELNNEIKGIKESIGFVFKAIGIVFISSMMMLYLMKFINVSQSVSVIISFIIMSLFYFISS